MKPTLFAAIVFGAAAICGAAETPVSVKVEQTPVNTWVKIGEEETGARDWPVFFFDGKLGRFVMSGGGVNGKPHYDTEFFNAAVEQWVNAYPEGVPYRAPAGPTDAPDVNFNDEKKDVLKADANGVARIWRKINPYMRDPGMYHQWAVNGQDGVVYAYFQDATLRFDTATRLWTDLKTPPFSKARGGYAMLYGSLAFDPVNKEVLSIGGTSEEDGGSPGTWAYSIAENTWKRVAVGSVAQKEIQARVRGIRVLAERLVNACRNRFYGTENKSEAVADLGAVAREGAERAKKLMAELKSSDEMASVAAGFNAVAEKVKGVVGAETLANGQAIVDAALRAERALDVEPCGRGVSQMAVDPVHGKVVLFGGCRLDSYLADTWVYDCKTRTWEQRHPAVCPSPRAGHVLAWLPKAGKALLYGATVFSSPYGVPHGNPKPAQELWTYDVVGNEWRLIGEMKEGPAGGTGAVDTNDTLLVVGKDAKNSNARVTWGMRVDAAAGDAGSKERGVAAGSIVQCFDSPGDFDAVSKPDVAGIAKTLKELPANRWTLLPAGPKKPNEHPWGKTPYDPARHQLLSFGGGHSAWHYTDVAHYSLRSATWSTGFRDEFPFAAASFSAMFNQTFNNHPTVPIHVWYAMAFDTVADRMVFSGRGGTWTYDPATRNWEFPIGPEVGGGSRVALGTTPAGVVMWFGDGRSSGDLKLYNHKSRSWTQLPLKSGSLSSAYCDTSGICYDSKRDALWLGQDGSPMVEYAMKGGATTAATPGRPLNICMRETVYVPEIDMLLNAGRVHGPAGQVGNLAYDIEKNKWIGIEMPCVDEKERLNDKPYSSISLSLHYDAELKLAVFLHNMQEVLVARFDQGALKTFEVTMDERKK